MNIPDVHQFTKFLDKKQIPYTKTNRNADYYERYQSKIRQMIFVFLNLTYGSIIALFIIPQVRMIRKISMRQMKISKVQPLKIKQKFKDIAGIEEAKKEILEFVQFLQNPQKFIDIGAKIPKGGLLTGPPGTGKTLLAKACAGEASVPFYYMSGSEFITGFVGQGSKRIKQLFEQAKKNSPSIIFIDELDAIGSKRSNQMGNSEGYSTLNQLLVEMDGFNTNTKVVVFGATNLSNQLDDALVRAGRFDRKIELTLPEKQARSAILDIHMKKLKIRKNEYDKIKESMANLSPGFCGADLENLCNEAAIFAVRNNQKYVEKKNFDSALDRIISGIETHNKLSEWQRKKIAYYESSKAVVSWYLKNCDPVMKMSLLSRVKKEKGFSQYFKKDQNLQTEEELIEKIAFLISGRICEQVIFNEITSMCQQDLLKAQDIAQKMVTKLGMTKNLGYLSLKDDNYKQYSEKTNIQIDNEIKEIILKASNISRKIILEKKDQLKNLALKLLENEKLDHLEIIEILGERPFEYSQAYNEYLEEHKKK